MNTATLFAITCGFIFVFLTTIYGYMLNKSIEVCESSPSIESLMNLGIEFSTTISNKLLSLRSEINHLQLLINLEKEKRKDQEKKAKKAKKEAKIPDLPPPPQQDQSSSYAKIDRAKVRSDHKCGPSVPTLTGEPTECDPNGEYPCCGKSGWCGVTPLHCECVGCIDYRTIYVEVTPNFINDQHIAIIVPYRDRETHFTTFKDHMTEFLKDINDANFTQRLSIFVIDQFDNRLFNRGWLFNVGYNLARQEMTDNDDLDCFAMQDIDNLPMTGVDYGNCQRPTQLSSEIECWQWSIPYPNNVGGSVTMKSADWEKVNGFSNEYWGWGGEDDDLYWRLRHSNMLHGGCFPFCNSMPQTIEIKRPRKGYGKYTCLHDDNHTPRRRSGNDNKMWERLGLVRSGNANAWLNDGIRNAKFKLLGKYKVPTDLPNLNIYWNYVSFDHKIKYKYITIVIHSGACRATERRSLKITKLPSTGDMSEFLKNIDENCEFEENVGNVFLFDFKTGHMTLATSTHKISRWIRNASWKKASLSILLYPVAEESSGILRLFEPTRYFIRLYPVCIGTAASQMGGGIKYRIHPSTDWCGDQGWTHLNSFNGIHPKDIYLLRNLGIKVNRVCVSLNSNGWVYRFYLCPGDEDPVTDDPKWKIMEIFYLYSQDDIHLLPKYRKQKSICFGKSVNGMGVLRWSAHADMGTCIEDGFVHDFALTIPYDHSYDYEFICFEITDGGLINFRDVDCSVHDQWIVKSSTDVMTGWYDKSNFDKWCIDYNGKDSSEVVSGYVHIPRDDNALIACHSKSLYSFKSNDYFCLEYDKANGEEDLYKFRTKQESCLRKFYFLKIADIDHNYGVFIEDAVV